MDHQLLILQEREGGGGVRLFHYFSIVYLRAEIDLRGVLPPTLSNNQNATLAHLVCHPIFSDSVEIKGCIDELTGP